MSATFCASPASTGGLHDGFLSGMRLDTATTTALELRQHDAQSFLSSESPFEDLEISPSSFVIAGSDFSDPPPSSDTGTDDWQLMPSPHHHHHTGSQVSSAESGSYGYTHQQQQHHHQQQQHQHGTGAGVQYIPRNLSLASTPSSLSSAAHSAGRFHPSHSASPAHHLRRHSPFYTTAQQDQQQALGDAFNQWITAASMQPVRPTVTDANFFTTMAGAMHVAAVSGAGELAAEAPPAQATMSWPVHGQRQSQPAQAHTMMYDPAYSNFAFQSQSNAQFDAFAPDFAAEADDNISPRSRDPAPFQSAWPIQQNFTLPEQLSVLPTDMEIDSGAAPLHRQLSFGSESVTSSDAAGRSKRPRPRDEPESAYNPLNQRRPSPAMKHEQPGPTADDSQHFQIEEYMPSAPPPRGHHTGPVRASASKRVGGRLPGSKFEPKKAEKIKRQREDGACWTCSLQRDECSEGIVCRRCERRAARPNADVLLMCDRTKLQDLKPTFIPPLYERKAVESFAREHINHWYKQPIQVPCKLIWGFDPVMVEMYEFAPRDDIIGNSLLGIDNWSTQKTDIQVRPSPPLGIMMVDLPELHLFNREFDDIVDNWLDLFVARFYAKDEDDFAPRLLSLMAELAINDKAEASFLRDVFRLLVVTYVLSHAVTIAESQRHSCLSQMKCYDPTTFQKHCGSKLANRQLKHLFSAIRDTLTDSLLKKLSQSLKASKRAWTSAFCAILGLAVAAEASQQLVHLVFTTEARDGQFGAAEAERRGVRACEGIDDRFVFVTKLFRLKYHAKFNPLRDHDTAAVQSNLSAAQLQFVRAVSALAIEKGEYLRDRAIVRISPDNSMKYTSRLVSSFLLSFWPPS